MRIPDLREVRNMQEYGLITFKLLFEPCPSIMKVTEQMFERREKYIMTFTITANNLSRKSEIKSLKLTSEAYDVKIFYMGDYENDRRNGGCDFRNVSMVCKPKGTYLLLALMSKEVMIDVSDNIYLRLTDIDSYRERLDIAVTAAVELQQLLKEYFDVEPE